MENKIEVEGGELALKNQNGSIAIIPKRDRKKINDFIKDGRNDYIDEYVLKLPKVENYAADGTLVDGDETADKKNEYYDYDPLKSVNENYYDAIGLASDYLDTSQSKLDSTYFYPLHKRIGEYLEFKKDTPLSELEEKHIEDIMFVTSKADPRGKNLLTVDNKFIREKYKKSIIEKSKVFEKLGIDIGEMSNEDMSSILNTDFSELKGMPLLKKLKALYDLKPSNFSIMEMLRYNKFIGGEEFNKKFGGNIKKSKNLSEDEEYSKALE